jgi:molecular chaperone DnaK (HSP70)
MTTARTLGIDFGTSNCTAFVQDGNGQVVPVPLEGDEVLLPTVLFATRREAGAGEDADDAPRNDQTFLSMLQGGGGVALFGTPALQAYIADPFSGTLVRSPKAFLGSDLPPGYVPAFT